jgi:HD superfamily phosphohydrolase
MKTNDKREATPKSLLGDAERSRSDKLDRAKEFDEKDSPKANAPEAPGVETVMAEESAAEQKPPKEQEQDTLDGGDAAERDSALAGKMPGGKKRPRIRDQGKPAEASPLPGALSSSSHPRGLPEKKLYQDEIYGTKELSPLAVAVMDTPEFQRLGHIYQLGFTYTVFRGANHRRFDHSVGTFFRVRTLLRRIVQNHARFFPSNKDDFRHPGLWLSPRLYIPAPGTPPDKQSPQFPMGRWRGLVEVVSAAAFLHDLGHVPAGHTLEDEFNIFEKHDGLGGARFFQMLYGPRPPKKKLDNTNGPPRVDSFFEPIEETLLPRPESWQRVPLPWVFEDGVYEPFLATDSNPDSLTNSEVRDLIYLILSFKDKILVDEHDTKYTTFKDTLKTALAKFPAGDERLDGSDLLMKRRIQFIDALYDYYSTPRTTGDESKPLFYPFMSDVVGNTICADLLDYLVRDGKRLKLDIRDNPRLQRYLVIRPDQSLVSSVANGGDADKNRPNLRVAIYAVHAPPGELQRRDTVSDLLDLMRERYRFAEIVYYHPKKAAFSAMLAKAMELLPDELRPADDETIYPAPWTPVSRTNKPHLAHFGDESLIQYISSVDKTAPSAELCHAITYRSEYRLLYTLDYDAAVKAGGTTKFLQDLRDDRDHGRRKREEELAALLRRDHVWDTDSGTAPPILIYCPSLRMQAKEVEARVELQAGYPKALNLHRDESTLCEELRILNEKYQRLWRLYLFVHPRLGAGLDRKLLALIRSSIVDGFCERYKVRTVDRARGCRFAYVSFSERIEKFYDRWTQDPNVKSWPKDVLDFVNACAKSLGFWQDVLGHGIIGHPLTANEYFGGFWHLAQIAAVDSASVNEKSEWLEELRKMQGQDWYTRAESTKKESARKKANEVFKALASVKETAARAPVQDWEQVRTRTIVELAKVKAAAPN